MCAVWCGVVSRGAVWFDVLAAWLSCGAERGQGDVKVLQRQVRCAETAKTDVIN